MVLLPVLQSFSFGKMRDAAAANVCRRSIQSDVMAERYRAIFSNKETCRVGGSDHWKGRWVYEAFEVTAHTAPLDMRYVKVASGEIVSA